MIKLWKDRIPEKVKVPSITIELAMQAEIDELRVALAEMTKYRNVNNVELGHMTEKCNKAEGENHNENHS